MDKPERDRLRTIVEASQLTDRVNRRDIVGKRFTEIQKDAQFFNTIANRAQEFIDGL